MRLVFSKCISLSNISSEQTSLWLCSISIVLSRNVLPWIEIECISAQQHYNIQIYACLQSLVLTSAAVVAVFKKKRKRKKDGIFKGETIWRPDLKVTSVSEKKMHRIQNHILYSYISGISSTKYLYIFSISHASIKIKTKVHALKS